MAWLIQGFFFQEQVFLGTKHRAESEGGIGVTIQFALMSFMWSGVIFVTEDGELSGELIDDFGESILTNIIITDDRLSFTKRYKERSDDISYTFSREDLYWLGEYSGVMGKGIARCILTKMPEEFFALEKEEPEA